MNAIQCGLAAGLAVLGCIGAASAQMPTDAQKNAIRSSCRADFQARCSGVQPGGQAALSCLQRNMSTLSPACQGAVGALGGGSGATAASPGAPAAAPYGAAPPLPAAPADRRTEMALLTRACRFDYREFCRGVRPGGGAVIDCLRANAQSLSPGCRSGLMSAQAQ